MSALVIAVAGTAWMTERGSENVYPGDRRNTRSEPVSGIQPRSVIQVSGKLTAPTGRAADGKGTAEPSFLYKADVCRSARKGLRWYRGWFRYWTHKMGAGTSLAEGRHEANAACPRYLAKVFRSKAFRARKSYERWYVYHYHWWEWLPLNWQDLGACETGYGRRPGNFEHSNSRFTSAFGISWAEYNDDAAYFGSPPWHVRHTPRDQYNAARGHLARFGDGWTCPGP